MLKIFENKEQITVTYVELIENSDGGITIGAVKIENEIKIYCPLLSIGPTGRINRFDGIVKDLGLDLGERGNLQLDDNDLLFKVVKEQKKEIDDLKKLLERWNGYL